MNFAAREYMECMRDESAIKAAKKGVDAGDDKAEGLLKRLGERQKNM